MALIKCIECGREFSEYAEACPNCGCPKEITLREAGVEAEPAVKETIYEESDPEESEKLETLSDEIAAENNEGSDGAVDVQVEEPATDHIESIEDAEGRNVISPDDSDDQADTMDPIAEDDVSVPKNQISTSEEAISENSSDNEQNSGVEAKNNLFSKISTKTKSKEIDPEQREKKRKKLKKILKIAGIIVGIIVALLIALVVFALVTADNLDEDLDNLKDAEINTLSYKYPEKWEASDQITDSTDNGDVILDEYNRYNKDDESFMARLRVIYMGDDGAIDFYDYYDEDEFFKNELGTRSITVGGTKVKVKEYDTEVPLSGTDEVVDTKTYTAEIEADYSDFFVLIDAKSDVYDAELFDQLVENIDIESYKNPHNAKSIEAKYIGERDPGTTIKSGDSNVEVTVEYDDGKKAIAQKWTIDKDITLDEGKTDTATISCHGLTCELKVSGRKPTKINAKYNGSTKAGETISEDDITVEVEFDTGEKENVSDWKMDKTVTLKAGETSTVKITYGDLSYDLKIQCTTLSESQYKDKCENKNYKNQLRKESFDEYIKIYGMVLQDCGEGYFRISSNGDYDDVYMVYAPDSDIVEDDHCTVYGVTAGIYEYETVMGASQKIPQIKAKYVDR